MSARPSPSSSYTRTFPFPHLFFTAQILNLLEFIQTTETLPSSKPFSLPRAAALWGRAVQLGAKGATSALRNAPLAHPGRAGP